MSSTDCDATPIRDPVQSGEVLPIAPGVTMSSGRSRGGAIPYGSRHAFAPSRQQPAALAGPSPTALRAAERTYVSAKAHPGPLRRRKGTAAPPRVGEWQYRGRRHWKGLGFSRSTYRPAFGARICRRPRNKPPRSCQSNRHTTKLRRPLTTGRRPRGWRHRRQRPGTAQPRRSSLQ
jgi:hypothetical protein